MQLGELFTVLQALPHLPQFKTSFETERQNPPQQVPPVPQGVLSPVHVSTHAPLGLHVLGVPLEGQSVALKHSTHWCVCIWQCCPLAQSPSALHPTVHWF
jgi:hypothetical protein